MSVHGIELAAVHAHRDTQVAELLVQSSSTLYGYKIQPVGVSSVLRACSLEKQEKRESKITKKN